MLFISFKIQKKCHYNEEKNIYLKEKQTIQTYISYMQKSGSK